MGQKRGKNHNNKRSRDDSNSSDGNQNNNRSYSTNNNFSDRTTLDHPLFTQYYRGNIVPEDEWDAMISCMREQLPIAFRVSDITGPQKRILEILNGECFGLPKTPSPVTSEDGTVSVTLSRPEVLPFYRPKGNAFQFDMGRRELKRFPQIEKFRQFLILHNHVGNITRQESVSMIPPLLLNVKPHHVVLDVCSAPGSKTSMLLEQLHRGLAPGEIPTGIIIANDANPDRAYMLVHQLKRLGSPAFMVTVHEGQSFPNLVVPQTSSIVSTGTSGFREGTFQTHHDKSNSYFTKAEIPQIDSNGQPLQIPLGSVLFDRILADVPCSGDGTCRKTPSIWSNWQLHNSFALHPLQLMIAWRSLQLLKIGGLMVYSTCSINPVEDEAVVMELIRRGKGSLELVHIPTILPELKHSPGRSEWKDYVEVPKEGQNKAHLVEITRLQDILDLPEKVIHKLRPTQFSPPLLQKLQVDAQIYIKEQIARWETYVAETKAKYPTLDEAKAARDQERQENIARAQAEKQTKIEASTPTATTTTTTSNDDVDSTTSTNTDNTVPNDSNNTQYSSRKKKIFKDSHVVNGFVRELVRMKYTHSIESINNTTRVLPHQQNTGGFFIALIRKNSQLPSLDESLVPVPDVYTMRYDVLGDVYNYDPVKHAVAIPGEDLLEASRISQKALNEQRQVQQQEEQATTTIPPPATDVSTTPASTQSKPQPIWNKDPFTPSPQNVNDCLSQVWGVNSSLSLLARNTNKHYMMSQAIREIILCPQNYRLKVVHGGLKVLEQDTFLAGVYNNDDVSTSVKLEYPQNHYYRVCQDGAQYLAPYINHQKFEVTKQDMILLLSQKESTNINDLSVAPLLLNKDGRPQTDLSQVIRAGSCLITYNEPEAGISISLAALKRAFSISLLVEPGERNAYKYLLGVEDLDQTADITPTTSNDPSDVVSLQQ